MRRQGLRAVLVALNVSVVLLAMAGLAIASAALLRRFIDDEALDHVRVAADGAARDVAREGDALAATVRLVAAQPELSAPLAARRYDEAGRRLAEIREEGGIYAAAVVRNGRVVAEAGPALSWTDAAAPWKLSATPAGGIQLVAAARSPVDPAITVALGVVFDAAYSKRLSETVGAKVTFDDAAHGIGSIGDPKLPLRAKLLHDAPPEARRLDAVSVYATVVALKDASGRVVGFMDVELPTQPAKEARIKLMRRVAQLTLGIGAI